MQSRLERFFCRIIIIFLFIPFLLVAEQTYTYDQSGRIIGVTFPSGNELGYQYDLSGNITEIDGVAQVEEPTTPTEPENPTTPTDPVTEEPAASSGTDSGGSPVGFDVLLFLLLILIFKLVLKGNISSKRYCLERLAYFLNK